MTDYDAIIIGTGQAGPPLARRLAASGRQVAVIERGRFGGTCINTGCTPTKTLVASAYAVHVARRGADYGFSAGDIKVDMKRVKARKDYVVGSLQSGRRTIAQEPEELHRLRRPRALCRAARGRGWRRSPALRQDLHQCRRPRLDPADPRPGPDQVPHQQLHDGCRFPAAPPPGAGRQLHRPGIRPDVPPLRQRGDDRRARAAPRPARGRGRVRGGGGVPRQRGHRRAARTPSASAWPNEATTSSCRSTARAASARSWARTC